MGSCFDKRVECCANSELAVELERTQFTQGATLPPLNQSCESLLDPLHPASRQRTIDWTRPVHEPRTVLHKQSNRPDHDCVHHFNLRRVQDAKFGISSKLQ